MLLPQPCTLLKARADYVYQSFQYPCTEWVPNDGDVPGYWIPEHGGVTSYIVRRFINNDLVVGKVTLRFFAITPSDASIVQGGDYENLVVDTPCRVTWVSHDATSRKPIPTAALIGGFLSATNTPLYVSRINGQIVGYFNPLNKMAWGQHGGIKNDTSFEIMVVQPPTSTT